MRRLRGIRDLVHDAIEQITGLVQETHEAGAKTPVELIAKLPGLEESVRSADQLRRTTAGGVFATIRGINRGVQEIGDAVAALVENSGAERLVAQAESALPAELRASFGAVADGAQGALNAVVGDFLKARGNGLAIDLSFYHQGAPLTLTPTALSAALGPVTSRLVVLVHGLGCTEAVFRPSAAGLRDGTQIEYARLLHEQRGFSAVHVRYNTGLHVSQNGRELAAKLDELVAAWPCEVEQLVLIGHSMGGLVCRSSVHYAAADGRSFLQRLSHVLCIGSPHHGAPLERASNALAALLGVFEVAGTQVPAKIINARSAGIKDLRYGYLLDEQWTDQDPDAFLKDQWRDVPLAEGVLYGFIAATWLDETQHPIGAWVGDLLVGVASASGLHADKARHIPFQLGHVLHGAHHLALLTHPEVYKQLLRFLQPAALEAELAPAS